MPNNQRSTRAANTYRRRRIGAGFTISGLLLMVLSFVTGGTAAAKSQPATSGDDKCYAQVDEYRYTREVPVMRTEYQYQKQTREHSRESVESEWGPWTDWAWWSPPSYKWSPTQVEVFEGPAAHAGDPNGTWYREYRYVPNGKTREVQTGTTTEDSGWVTSQPAGDGWTQVDHRVVNGEEIPCPTTTTTTTAPQPKGSLSLSCADNGTVALTMTLEQESTVSNVSDGVILVGDDGSDTLVVGVTLPAGTYTGRYEGTASSVVVQFSNGLSLSRDVPNCTQPTPASATLTYKCAEPIEGQPAAVLHLVITPGSVEITSWNLNVDGGGIDFDGDGLSKDITVLAQPIGSYPWTLTLSTGQVISGTLAVTETCVPVVTPEVTASYECTTRSVDPAATEGKATFTISSFGAAWSVVFQGTEYTNAETETITVSVTPALGAGSYEWKAYDDGVLVASGTLVVTDNCELPAHPGGTAVAECDNVKVTNTGDVTLDLEVGGVPAGTIAAGEVKNLGDVYDTTGGIEIALLYQGNPVYSDVLQKPEDCEQPVINSVKILLNKDCDGNVVSGKIVVDGSHPLDAISISGAIPDVPEGVNELVLSGDGLAAAAAAQAGSGATWEIGSGEIHGTVDFVVNEPEPGSCVKKVAIPAQPSVTDPCGANNATWNVPADTAELYWTLRADGHLVVRTQPGFIFTDGTTEKDFGVAPDSGEACPPTTTPGTNPPPPTTVAPTTTISPQLPATGGSSTSLLLLLGMSLVLVGGALLVGSNGRRPYGLS